MEKHATSRLETPRDARLKGADRRSAPRYAAADTRCRVGWWEGQEFREGNAVLLNVSTGGALVTSNAAPPTGLDAWFRLDGAKPSPWIQAELIKVTKTWWGPGKLSFAFRSPCPYEMFKSAAFEPSVLGIPADPAPGAGGDDYGWY